MIISTNYVVTRKEHRCWGCGIKFPPKTSMAVTKSVDEGEMRSVHWCAVCNAFWKEYAEDFEEGINFGEFAGEEVYEKFKQSYVV